MYKICYACHPCLRAGRQFSKDMRECNGWKDPSFVGCAGLEDPKSTGEETADEQHQIHHPKEKTAMQIALEKAGLI